MNVVLRVHSIQPVTTCFAWHMQVEGEMRELLSIMEQQKAASASKVKQLATILQDMQSGG